MWGYQKDLDCWCRIEYKNILTYIFSGDIIVFLTNSAETFEYPNVKPEILKFIEENNKTL